MSADIEPHADRYTERERERERKEGKKKKGGGETRNG